jgi:hypothetical protein
MTHERRLERHAAPGARYSTVGGGKLLPEAAVPGFLFMQGESDARPRAAADA